MMGEMSSEPRTRWQGATVAAVSALAAATIFAGACGTTSGSGSAETANSARTDTNVGTTELPKTANPDGTVPEPTRVETAELPPVKPVKRAAPDDSEYWSTLTDVAREYREFKNNPQIKQVVRLNDGTNSVLQIHLKNGKVVEKPGNQIRNMATESVTTFIRLAGLTPPPIPQPSRGEPVDNPDKKREKSSRP